MLDVLVRCDASAEIGFGHLMRCIALAERLTAAGDAVTFLIREEEGAARILRRAGLDAVWLPRRCALGTVLGRLQRIVAEGRSAGRRPWVVLDSYEAPQRQSETALEAGAQVLVVDDLGSMVDGVQMIVNPNLDAAPAWYPHRNGTRLLLGAPYVLLRREFREVPRREAAAEVRRLLVTLGGSDAHNRTALILNGLSLLEERWRRALEVDVVLGFGSTHAEAVERLAATLPLRCRVHRSVDRMAALFAGADMAVTAAGGTVYEAARFGVPVAMVTLSEHQQRNAEAFVRSGLGVALGDAAALTPQSAATAIGALLEDARLRVAMSARGPALIDGQGPERIRQAMEPA